MQTKVITNFPIAFDSPDHMFPTAVINDNGGSNIEFYTDIESHYGKKIKLLDLGCAGGQSVIDLNYFGHYAIGLEGSNAGFIRGTHNWPRWYNDVLFTCDITRPFHVERDGKKVLFDLITSWEVLEHLQGNEISNTFQNVLNNLSPDGMFVGSVGLATNTNPDTGFEYHRTLIKAKEWDELFKKDFDIIGYPFESKIRENPMSYNFGLMRKEV